MLPIKIPDKELYIEEQNEFITIKGCTLQLEHSLASISKWEAKWEKPFLSTDNKTTEQLIDYVRCMTITENVDPNVYYILTPSQFSEINEYINAKMSATWFSKDSKGPSSRKIITSEVIYYWMVAFNIPFECENWHLNRLITLIRICGEENKPKKKLSKKEILSRNKSLNAARRAALNTKG